MNSKYLKDLEVKKTKIIHVYPNGDAYARATFVLLRLLEQKDMERIIRAIEEKVRLPLNRPIRKLFEMSGILVTSFIQIEDGKYYVAASAENFLPLEYGHGLGWVRVGPVRTDKYANVHYVSRSEEEGTSKSLSSSHTMLSSTKDTIKITKRQKSPAKRTPANLKKASKQISVPKKDMVTSEHTSPPSLLNEMDINREEVVRDGPHDVIETENQGQGIHHGDRESGYEKEYEDSLSTDIVEDKKEENGHNYGYQDNDKNEEVGHNGGEEGTGRCDDNNYEDDHAGRIENEDREKVLSHEEEHDNHNAGKAGEVGGGERVEEDNHDGTGEDVMHVLENHGEMIEDDGREERYDEAATKIQATFRGHRVRSDLERKKENLVNDSTDVSEEINSQKDEF